MNPRAPKSRRAFTLVEILISIMILALGLLGLGVLFPVVIREQRMGVDASTGVIVAGTAKDVLTTPQWARGLPRPAPGVPHPAITNYGFDGGTEWLWAILRNREYEAPTPAAVIPDGLGQGFNSGSPMSSFQRYGQGEWFTRLVVPTTGTAKIGFPNSSALVTGQTTIKFGTLSNPVTACVDLPVQQRLYPQHGEIDPQFVWDFAVQRVSSFNFYNSPDGDDLRAVFFVRRVDTRIRPKGTAKTILDAIANVSGTVANADRLLPVGEDANGNPTFDGTDGAGGLRYSPIHTCEVEFWYTPSNPAQNHTDRLYIPTGLVDTTVNAAALKILFAQMKQPGQKLVDNLGNIYTVIGSGNETGVTAQNLDGVAGADYLRVDPPISVAPERASPLAQMTSYTSSGGEIRRAIWQVSFTPQVPVAVTIVDLIKGGRP